MDYYRIRCTDAEVKAETDAEPHWGNSEKGCSGHLQVSAAGTVYYHHCVSSELQIYAQISEMHNSNAPTSQGLSQS